MGLGKDILQIEFKVLILLLVTNTVLCIVEQALLSTEEEPKQSETFKWPLIFCAIWSLSIAIFIILLKQLITDETREKCNHLLTCTMVVFCTSACVISTIEEDNYSKISSSYILMIRSIIFLGILLIILHISIFSCTRSWKDESGLGNSVAWFMDTDSVLYSRSELSLGFCSLASIGPKSNGPSQSQPCHVPATIVPCNRVTV